MEETKVYLHKDKSGTYWLSKDGIPTYCPYQMPNFVQEGSVNPRQIRQAMGCNSGCAKFSIHKKSDANGVIVNLSCGSNTEYFVDNENIIEIKDTTTERETIIKKL